MRKKPNMEVLKEILKYPCIYHKQDDSQKPSDEEYSAWANIASIICGEKWWNLSEERKHGKVTILRGRWLISQERKHLKMYLRNKQLSSANLYNPLSIKSKPEGKKSEQPISVIQSRNSSLLRRKLSVDPDRRLLVLYLLPVFKQLGEKDKRDVIHRLYFAINQYNSDNMITDM